MNYQQELAYNANQLEETFLSEILQKTPLHKLRSYNFSKEEVSFWEEVAGIINKNKLLRINISNHINPYTLIFKCVYFNLNIYKRFVLNKKTLTIETLH